MTGFIEGLQRSQTSLLPDRLDDWIGEDDLFRVVDLFVDELELSGLGFNCAMAARTGRHTRARLTSRVHGHAGPVQ